jgi:predicted phosphate transport protein (TIGR00153 family)
MFGRLMPKEGRFFDLFNDHAALIVEGAHELNLFMNDMGSREAHAQNVGSIEKKADKITYETILLLHQTFVTPLDRDDIHKLISSMDDILDLMEDVAECVVLYDVREVTDAARKLAEICVNCAEKVKQAVGMLSNLDNSQAILKICSEIDQLESEADRVMRSAMSKLFRDEPDTRQLIKLKAIYELLESITDRAEDTANVIEGIVLENA